MEISPEMPQAGAPGAGVPGVTPAPLREIIEGELLASLATETLPVAPPVAAGANVTVRSVEFPGPRVVVAPTPLALKPVPLTVTAEKVRLAFPLLAKVTPRELVPPTLTLPKVTLLGLAVSCGAAVVTPAPDRATVVGEFWALLVIAKVPETAPEEDGAKRICKVALLPAAMKESAAPCAIVKALLEILVWETVIEAVPPFVRVTVCVALPPTETFPKLMVVGLGERIV